MSHPFRAGKPKLNALHNEPSENHTRNIHPIGEVPAQLSRTTDQLGHHGDLGNSPIGAGNHTEHSLGGTTSNRSKRPGRGGNISCDRCRVHKNHVKKPCTVDPNDPNGACYPCVQAGLSEKCGERLPPPKRLARDRSRDTQHSMIHQTLAAERFENLYMSEVTSATQVDAIDLTKLDSKTDAPPTPEQIDFVDRFADLRNIDLNVNRPTHGLDQQPLVSNPNVEPGATASFFGPLFGEQEFALQLGNLHTSSSMLAPEGFLDLPITPPDLQPIHTLLFRRWPSLSPSIIIDAVDNMVANLSALAQEGETEEQEYFPDYFAEADAMGRESDKM